MPRLTARGLRLKRQCRSCARGVRSRPRRSGRSSGQDQQCSARRDARLSAAACAAGGRAIAGALRSRRPARRTQAPRVTRGSMPAIVPPIDRREQGRLFGTVVADAFDDHEERQAGDQQGNAAMGAPALACGRGSGAWVVARPRRGAGGLARARDASRRGLHSGTSTLGNRDRGRAAPAQPDRERGRTGSPPWAAAG
jgi:hypothetical protein